MCNFQGKRVYLTTAEAARVLNVSDSAVRPMVERGEVAPAAYTLGGTFLFDMDEVIAAYRKRRHWQPPNQTQGED